MFLKATYCTSGSLDNKVTKKERKRFYNKSSHLFKIVKHTTTFFLEAGFFRMAFQGSIALANDAATA